MISAFAHGAFLVQPGLLLRTLFCMHSFGSLWHPGLPHVGIFASLSVVGMRAFVASLEVVSSGSFLLARALGTTTSSRLRASLFWLQLPRAVHSGQLWTWTLLSWLRWSTSSSPSSRWVICGQAPEGCLLASLHGFLGGVGGLSFLLTGAATVVAHVDVAMIRKVDWSRQVT